MALALAVILRCTPLVAQEPEAHRHPGGNPGQLGRVHFPISCGASLQGPFETAVAMLHSFWYEEAASAFTRLAEAEPGCAMAHWGLAMSLWHPLWIPPATPAALQQGLHAVAKAKAAQTKTPRESGYVAAVDAYFRDSPTLDSRARALAYEKAMERLHAQEPEDREAATFYALALLATAAPTDKTYAQQLKAASLLEPIFEAQPDHPGAAHYVIHSFDVPPLAARALPAARSYARIAPAAPHALHMPSHIFTRLGLWPESITSNIASEQAALDYAQKTHMNATWDEQLHAMDYLEYAYLQVAEDEKARAVLDELSEIARVEPANAKTYYAFAAIPARFALERRRYAEAAGLTSRPGGPPWAEAVTQFARGYGAARSGAVASAEGTVAVLASLKEALLAAQDRYWADQVEVQRLAVAGWTARAKGESESALLFLRSAADLEDTSEKMPVTPGPVIPAREQLADLLLELGRPAEALVEYEAALRQSPNRFGSLWGASRAAARANEPARARVHAQALVTSCAASGTGRPELLEARALLSSR